ncbi:hypothetical protein ACO0OL_001436 [Hanseniaspora opuntiae]
MEDKNSNSYDESFFENIRLEYPAWFNDLNKDLDYTSDEDFYYKDNSTGNSPVSFEEIHTIFEELQKKFGFQTDNMKNMYIHLLTQLDSRASRMSAKMALITLHADYIGGDHANYRKWYFSCQLDLDEEVGFNNLKLHGKSHQRNKSRAKKNNQKLKTYWEVLDNQQKSRNEIDSTEFKSINFFPRKRSANPDFSDKDIITLDKSITANILKSSNESLSRDASQENPIESNKKESFKKQEHKRKKYWKKKGKSLKYCTYLWKKKMNNLSYTDMIRQVGLYLLCWGEANNIRFTPECLCFIFKCCLDYDQYTSTLEKTTLSEQDNLLYQNKPEFFYLDGIITPIYNFLQQSVYEMDKDGNLQRKPKDHKDVIGYDDVNQLFWYPEGIELIVLNDGTRLIDKPFNQSSDVTSRNFGMCNTNIGHNI